MKVAIAQMAVPYFDKARNEEKILSLVERAVEAGANLVLFPEAANLGYFMLDRNRHKEEILSLATKLAPAVESSWTEELRRQAKKGIYIACGTIVTSREGGLSNALLLVSPSGDVVFYYKTHLYHTKETSEQEFIERGSHLMTAETDFGTFGLSICYDLNFPEVARTLAMKGSKVILLSAAWPRNASASWDTLIPARAIENELYVVASGQVGGGYYGHGKVVDYQGKVLVEFGGEEEGLKTAELDFERQKKWRSMVTFFEDRMPDVYDLRSGIEETSRTMME